MLTAKKPSPAARSGWNRLRWRGKPRTRHRNRYHRNIRKYQRKSRNRKIGRLMNAYQYPALLRESIPPDFKPYQVAPATANCPRHIQWATVKQNTSSTTSNNTEFLRRIVEAII